MSTVLKYVTSRFVLMELSCTCPMVHLSCPNRQNSNPGVEHIKALLSSESEGCHLLSLNRTLQGITLTGHNPYLQGNENVTLLIWKVQTWDQGRRLRREESTLCPSLFCTHRHAKKPLCHEEINAEANLGTDVVKCPPGATNNSRSSYLIWQVLPSPFYRRENWIRRLNITWGWGWN